MRPSVSPIRTLLQLRLQPVLREDVLSATCKRATAPGCVQRRQYRRCLVSNHGPLSKPPPPPSMALFQQQMQELQREQQEISGIKQTDNAVVSAVPTDHHENADEQHRLFQEQMEQLQVEREELFGFTHEEHSAWSNYGSSSSNNNNNNHHSADWMKTLQEARRQQQEHHNALKVDYDNNESRPFSTSSPSSIQPLTHVSSDGSSVHMADVGMKEVTRRVAVAQSKVMFPANVMQALQVANDLVGPKGPILATAKLAGIMAAKRTSDLIPLCHPLPLEQVHVDITLQGNTAVITCECRVTHKTGVEMEALTGASIAALTIYDMVKAVSHEITIEETRLVSKTGGKRNVGMDPKDEPGY